MYLGRRQLNLRTDKAIKTPAATAEPVTELNKVVTFAVNGSILTTLNGKLVEGPPPADKPYNSIVV